MSLAATNEGLSAADSAYNALRKLLLSGEFAPGERLTGTRLTSLLGVSRTPVRAALVRLEKDGLVEITGGQSARVRPITALEVEHAYDVAGGLEGVLVYRLAYSCTPDQFRGVEAAVEEMEVAAATGDNRSWAEGDERFHSLLAEYGDNELINQMMDRVETIIGRLRFLALHVGTDSAKTSAAEHRAVLDAMSHHDARRARELHQAHWERVRDVNTTFLQDGFAGIKSYF